jgi:hypothetical protein
MSERALIVRHALALALVAALFLALLRRALNGRAQAARPDANGLPER